MDKVFVPMLISPTTPPSPASHPLPAQRWSEAGFGTVTTLSLPPLTFPSERSHSEFLDGFLCDNYPLYACLYGLRHTSVFVPIL